MVSASPSSTWTATRSPRRASDPAPDSTSISGTLACRTSSSRDFPRRGCAPQRALRSRGRRAAHAQPARRAPRPGARHDRDPQRFPADERGQDEWAERLSAPFTRQARTSQRGGRMAAGMLTLEELKREIAAGTIDTVVAAMVDMQGRLIGKRFHAQFFADSGHEETHGCNYLLGVDIEMEPVPGYKADELGKGLRRLRPQARHGDAAAHALAPRHRAGDLRRARSSHPRGRAALAARHAQEAAQAPRGHEAQGLYGVGARVLPVRRQLRERQPEGLPQPQDGRALHRGLPHPADDQGRGRDAGHPQRPARRRHPGREFQGRVGPGPGGDQCPVCRGAGDGGPARHHQERLQGNRLWPGQGHHLHGQVGLRHGRQLLPRPPVAVVARTASRRCSSTRRATTACRRR